MKRYTEAEKKEVVQMAGRGIPVAAISRETGVAIGTIRTWLLAAGVSTDPRRAMPSRAAAPRPRAKALEGEAPKRRPGRPKKEAAPKAKARRAAQQQPLPLPMPHARAVPQTVHFGPQSLGALNNLVETLRSIDLRLATAAMVATGAVVSEAADERREATS